ncbi:SusC/RagA family TonB-linked outer membrane protein [Gemmatirosa kalamazoonensis]|nr:TonB-dependent receptor [Gemmatirosa kalamazoonensis]
MIFSPRSLWRVLQILAPAVLLLAAREGRAQVTVRGTVVVGQTGEPVPNANVAVAGTRVGTQTNDQGEFTLRVPGPNDTLVVTRLGYAPSRLPLRGQTLVTVRLERTAVVLSEIVTVGYGTQKRSDITGSVTSINQERLENKPNVNVAQALEGALPGVNVTTSGAGAEQTIDIQIRGRNSISASTAPLVVVDGIPYNGSLSELNPNDIQSIEILKDASSTAIYGARGSNGVILVTSKRGTEGKPTVSYSGYVGSANYTNVPRLMNAQEFADFKCVRINAGANCSTALTATEQKNLAAGVNTNWLDVAMRTGKTQQHDVSVRGGSTDTKYFLGGSYLGVDGIGLGDRIDRLTVRANLDQKLWSWLNIGTNTQVSDMDRGGRAATFESAFFANPLLTPYDANGNIAVVPWPEDPVTTNPLDALNAVDDDVNKRLFSSNYLRLTVPRVKGLTFTMNGGLDVATREQATYWGLNTNTGRSVNGQSSVANTDRTDWTWENILRYQRGFGKHNLDFTGLLSRQGSDLEVNGVNGTGYPNDVLNFRSTVPLLATPVASVTQYNLVSQMGRLNYGFDERYLATFTVRRDGYSGFGANNKYGVFPSAALAWNAANEKFFPWKHAVNTLKVRLTYGQNGNQAIRPYQTLAQLDDRSYLNGDTPAAGYIPVSLGNPNLKWETTTSGNLGVDLGLWNDRVHATLDAYRANTRDLLLRRTISSVHGITSITQNIGKTANKGIELQLSTINVDRNGTRGGFRWQSDFNISANRNRIVDLYGDATDDLANGWFIGQPIDVNYSYKFAGIWQVADSALAASFGAKPGWVRIQDTNGDGKIDPTDRTLIGSLQPDYIAGLQNSFRYRGFTLSAYVYTVQGVTRSNILLGTNQVFSDVRRNTVFRQYWTRANPIDTYPENSNVSNPLSVPFYEDASFVRLRDLSLSYDLPRTFASRLGASSARVYVNGRNLKTWTKWTGLDPELSNQRAIPLERTVTGGINVTF